MIDHNGVQQFFCKNAGENENVRENNTRRQNSMNMQVWMGILLPFLGTGLGAAMGFVLKDQISDVALG